MLEYIMECANNRHREIENTLRSATWDVFKTSSKAPKEATQRLFNRFFLVVVAALS